MKVRRFLFKMLSAKTLLQEQNFFGKQCTFCFVFLIELFFFFFFQLLDMGR
jgi:hypothetical protein